MSDKQQILTVEQQDIVFRTKADLLAELIKFQTPDKPAAEQLVGIPTAHLANNLPTTSPAGTPDN